MFLTNYLLSDILQYVFNLYVDHQKDVHSIQKFTHNFEFNLKPFTRVETINNSGGMRRITTFIDDMKFKGVNYYRNENSYASQGKFFEINYLYGIAECKSYDWYRDGKIERVEEYKNNLKNGKSIKYHENGNIMYELQYKDGKLDGLCKKYNKNGIIEIAVTYKDLKRNGTTYIYNNGKDPSILEYKDDIPNNFSLDCRFNFF
jgi:antitoxin component YwqK of YwqJK toxin-antitoxin module